jgi:hypothetical protein
MLSAIDKLYARFDGMYMQKWKSNFPSTSAIDNWNLAWADALSRHGIKPSVAFAAVQKCEAAFPWPPSLPEFIALCRPPLDYEQAFHDAVAQLQKRHSDEHDDFWPQPAIYWAAIDYGQFELRNASYGQAAARWKRLLDKRLEGECPAVQPFALQLAAPARNAEGAAITSEEAKAAAMAAMANLAAKRPSRDVAIDRARAVIARRAAGELVTPFQFSHAKEVLARLCGSDADSPANDE